MSRKVDEQEQARTVKVRLRLIQHFQQLRRNASPTCRFFGISRSQFYIWLGRYGNQGQEGLRNDSSFGPQFTGHLADLGIAHRHIPPLSPEVNGKV